jgi:hemerythrin
MISWSPSYQTGVASIDTQHQKLVGYLNDLEAAIAAGAGSREIPALVAKMEAYADEHFRHEEGCMHQMNCPTAQINISAHREFMNMVAAAKQRLAGGGGGAALIATRMHRELSDWMINHILRIDVDGLKRCRHGATQLSGATGR